MRLKVLKMTKNTEKVVKENDVHVKASRAAR